ncbi:MAG TPA: beta-eliminating lyase-related protein [Candidatus Binatia bacterium]|nr:beta-eliminating lyase-related protein [Candidatus Binatia bacterium]
MRMFYDDYSEGAHPAVLEALVAHNGGQELGYGLDRHTQLAAERIAAQVGCDCEVHLLTGGTQANLTCLGAFLRPHEGVIAAQSAHINVHETGAVEATGHRILQVPTPSGKLTPEQVAIVLAEHVDEHMPRPGGIFIAEATELGSVYTLGELRALCAHAHDHGLWVYLDGARLAQALAALHTRLDSVAACGVDAFFVGGTKNGALCGEAVVLINDQLRRDFRYHMKQRGALLAKGRVLGIQFARLFDGDDLWYRLGTQANAAAARLARGLSECGVPPRAAEANQVFVELPNGAVERLAAVAGFHIWTRGEQTSLIRLVCSWATDDSAVDGLLANVRQALSAEPAASDSAHP